VTIMVGVEGVQINMLFAGGMQMVKGGECQKLRVGILTLLRGVI
jgi:hypothetical protein